MYQTHDRPECNKPACKDARLPEESPELTSLFPSKETGMRPRLGVRKDGLWTVVEFIDVEELFDENIVRAIGDHLLRLIEGGHDRMVIDLGAIRYVSSYMLGQLIRIQRKIDQTPGALRLRRLDPSVHHLFRICRLEQLFTIFDRESEPTASSIQER